MRKVNVYMTRQSKPAPFTIEVDKDVDSKFLYHVYIYCEDTKRFILSKCSNVADELTEFLAKHDGKKALVINPDGQICMTKGDIHSVIASLS